MQFGFESFKEYEIPAQQKRI